MLIKYLALKYSIQAIFRDFNTIYPSFHLILTLTGALKFCVF